MQVAIYIKTGEGFGHRDVVDAHLMIRDEARARDGSVLSATDVPCGRLVTVEIGAAQSEIFAQRVNSHLKPLGRKLDAIYTPAPAFTVAPL